ncbi:hypothetical protein E2C01_091944 [Portunus trituberculatus]|uniref:Uncharacterized protein n=1 Tax=Portunus trituberculatus TaxID=210409 RepID=A0A5B7JQF7_PORTR|nr:hypothetical protein [Portunus trituberculatus]
MQRTGEGGRGNEGRGDEERAERETQDLESEEGPNFPQETAVYENLALTHLQVMDKSEGKESFFSEVSNSGREEFEVIKEEVSLNHRRIRVKTVRTGR